MKYRTLRPVRLQTGAVKVGAVIELPEPLARMLLRRGDIERATPMQATGQTLSALPVVRVSEQTTSSESETGVKRTPWKTKSDAP